MINFRSVIIGGLLAILAVIAIQPIFFLAMANLDRVLSHDTMRSHFRDAFKSGALSVQFHRSQILFTGGDRFTDCIALSVGMRPGDTPLVAGLAAPMPVSAQPPCEELSRLANDISSIATWVSYERYWHGYRVYYAPMVSLFPIYAVKLFNLAFLVGAFLWFSGRSREMLGSAATIGLVAPIIFLSDFLRVWQVTPHVIGVVFILGGAAAFSKSIQKQRSVYALLVLAAILGAIFNFIDFLVNPPWMPMLLAFFVMAGARYMSVRQRFTLAILVILAWFGGYALTWFCKWLITSVVLPGHDVITDVRANIAFRIDGSNDKVSHFLFASSFKVWLAAILSWSLPFFLAVLIASVRYFRANFFSWREFGLLAWPAAVPIVWFEILRNHSQIHAGVTSRSAAASFGVMLAAALIASKAKTFALSRRGLEVA